jgi:hypothetical protein
MRIHFPEKNTQEKRDKPFPYSLDLFEEDGYGNRFIKSMPTPLELQEFYAKNFARQSYQRCW